MENICRALCLGQKSGNLKKNKDIAVSKNIEKSLRNWKPPPYSTDTRGSYISVKKKITLGEGYATFPLFSDSLSRKLRKKFCFLSVLAIQVSLKPTKLGSNASAIICLRDRRSKNFEESVFCLVESSLTDGPIYFSYFPTRSVCLSDNVSSSFTIDIKTSGMHEDENLLLLYRLKYVVARSSVVSYLVASSYERNSTTLFLTYVAQSNRVVSRDIYWDQVALPKKWITEDSLLPSDGSGETGAKALFCWEETPETYVLEVDVSGLKREEVRVEVEAGRIIQISGERRKELQEMGHAFLCECEERCRGGKFLRRFRLPVVGTAMEQMTVEVENGVLTVTVPKENVKKM